MGFRQFRAFVHTLRPRLAVAAFSAALCIAVSLYRFNLTFLDFVQFELCAYELFENRMKLVTIEYAANGRRVGQSHGRARYTDLEVAQAKELYSTGMSVRAIARKLDIPRPTVCLWLHEKRRACIPARVVRVRRDTGEEHSS